MVVEQSNTSTSGWLLVNGRIAVGLLGAVACYAWLFLALSSSVFFPGTSGVSQYLCIDHVCFVLGAIATMLYVRCLSDFFGKHKVMQFCLSVVISILSLACLYVVQGQLPFSALAAFLFGCGFGFLYPLYGEFVCLFFYGSMRPYVHGIFLCAAFLCLGVFFTSDATSLWFAIIFPIAAFFCYAFVMASYRLQSLPIIDGSISDSRNKVSWHSYLATATSGLTAGYALGCLLSLYPLYSGAYIVVEFAVLPVLAGLLVDSLRNQVLTETVTMKLFLPVSAVLVFPLAFVPDEQKCFLAALLLAMSLFSVTCSVSAICKHIVICDLSPVRAFSFGRCMCFVGLLIGLVLGFIGYAPFLVERFGLLLTFGSMLGFSLLVIFSASFVMTEDNYPDESRFKVSKEGSSEKEVAVSPGTPIRKIDSPAAESMDSAETAPEEESAPHIGLFQMKCDVVAEAYGLSVRQREVLGMLAKGRNADYITEKLVISSHTAKAHIYNIYQKTGVHSRQELMDLVEDIELPDIRGNVTE